MPIPLLLLFLLLCLRLPLPARSDDPDPTDTPPIPCSGFQSYIVQFAYTWSLKTDIAFPITANSVTPGFSPLICVAHNSNFTLWAKEKRISSAVRTLLINVTNDDIIILLEQAVKEKSVLQYQASGDNNVTANALISLALSFSADNNFTLLSCIAKVIPSSDWFVGLSNIQTCNPNGSFVLHPQQGTLFGWDGGTDTAETYTDSIPLIESQTVVVKPALLEAPLGYGKASITPTDLPTPSPTPPSPSDLSTPQPIKNLPPSPFVPPNSPNPRPVSTSFQQGVCIDANALSHLPTNSLVYANHQMARVLCDAFASCATHGHMVYYLNKPMMMSSYCRLTPCTQQIMHVNSPRYSRALRIPSNTPQLQFTAFAARYATDIEENLMSLVIRLGL